VAEGDVLVEVDGRPVSASIGMGEFKSLLGSLGRPSTLTFNFAADDVAAVLSKAAAVKTKAGAIAGAERSVVAGSDEARCKLLPAAVVMRLMRELREAGGRAGADRGVGEKEELQEALLSQTAPAEMLSSEGVASAAAAALARMAMMDVTVEPAMEKGGDEERAVGGDGNQLVRGRASEDEEGAGDKSPEKSRIDLSKMRKRGILGRGFFGTVYLIEWNDPLASSHTSPRPLALKRMFKQAVVQHKQEAHVLAEKDILERVPPSAFLLNLQASFQDRDCLYLLTNFVQGGELLSILPEDGLEPEYALFYFANVLLALSHLHKYGVIYRDLKPENCLIARNGYVVLIDMGFAKRVPWTDTVGAEEVTHHVTYTMCGTPEYAAPESLLMKGCDRGVDYWALGILLHEMAMGVTPFAPDEAAGENQKSIFKKLLRWKNGTYPQLMEQLEER
jgi:hypothetical protein